MEFAVVFAIFNPVDTLGLKVEHSAASIIRHMFGQQLIFRYFQVENSSMPE
jgi:hypothetical protein